MSRKPSFATLRDRSLPEPVLTHVETKPSAAGPVSRVGRKQIAGFFTPEMSFPMHMLARRRGRSLQAVMAEAFNDVLRKRGESPIGE